MGLRSRVDVEFIAIRAAEHEGVVFDNVLASMTPVASDDIDRRDALGRTALMRAAARGYDRQVEQLLEAGADPNVVDDRGRCILELARGAWIISMIEKAIAKESARAAQRS
jgi:ankyrin repeat protein